MEKGPDPFFVCVHGHFYQPPREDAWFEVVARQESAQPFHDWNERITAECYGPCAAARVLESDGRIARLVNLYERISFDFGPTLLAWLEREAPRVHRAVVEADHASRRRHGGHGGALAHAWHHVILPLATPRDRATELRWGVRDFERRFGRAPEGLWLPECAVDTDTLEDLAAQGLRFTVLAPHQARRVRPLAGGPWRRVDEETLDTGRAYVARLPSGRSIALFFYDGGVSRGIAFEQLLSSGDELARRLLAAARPGPGPRLVHCATDGETFGHHHPFGEMGLAWALERLEASGAARLTNYGEFLELHPPEHEVEIVERSSWSCPHGIERWRSDCGCGGEGNAWRAPLREALEGLRDRAARVFEERGEPLWRDPWAVRDDYVSVLADRSRANGDAFLARHAARPLSGAEEVTALRLLELERQTLAAFTSCAWFFDDVSRIETIQVLQHAARALQLVAELSGAGAEEPFVERLRRAPSRDPAERDGARVWTRRVRPAVSDPARVAAHHAIRSLFEPAGEVRPVYAWDVEEPTRRTFQVGGVRLALGQVTVTSTVTRESGSFVWVAVHLGAHDVTAGVRPARGPTDLPALLQEFGRVLERPDPAALLRFLDRALPATHALAALFPDARLAVADGIAEGMLAQAEAAWRERRGGPASLLEFLAAQPAPLPEELRPAAALVLAHELRGALAPGALDPARVAAALREAERLGAALETAELRPVAEGTLAVLADRARERPGDPAPLRDLETAARLARALPGDVDLREAWRVAVELRDRRLPALAERARAGDPAAREWLAAFESLAAELRVRA